MLTLIHSFDMPYENVLEYHNAFACTNYSDINCYAIRLTSISKKRYFDWLSRYGDGMYYLVDDTNPNYIIGFGSFEDSSAIDFHEEYLNIGHISYGIRPNERQKGYGTKLLELLLIKCEESGMPEVCISCKNSNVASEKIILKNGGVFEKNFYGEYDGYGLKYWIKLHPKIKNKINRFKKTHELNKEN